MCTTFKVFIEFVNNIASVSCFVFLATEAYAILAPQPGTEPTTPALEDGFLTTGAPGKSP